VILSLGSLLTKFDNERYETFCTIISLACTIVGAILPSLSQNVFDEGNPADGSASDSRGAPDGTCIEALLAYLPGCVLANTALLVTEEQARTYLRYALLNLVSSPMMFFVSALPDLLTICGCCSCKKGGYDAL
jgi:hypothetical protein